MSDEIRAESVLRGAEFVQALESVVLANVVEGANEELAAAGIEFAFRLGVGTPLLVLCDAYQALYWWMDADHLAAARERLLVLTATADWAAAASCLLAQVLVALGAPREETMRWARLAVERAPDWATPRVVLADLLMKGRKWEDAARELRVAGENRIGDTEKEELSEQDYLFKELFTGRLVSSAGWDETIEALHRKTRRHHA